MTASRSMLFHVCSFVGAQAVQADALLVKIMHKAFSGRKMKMQADLVACCMIPYGVMTLAVLP